MPDQKYHTKTDEKVQEIGDQDDWAKEIVPRLPVHLEEQANKRHPLSSGVERSAKPQICCEDCLPMCTWHIPFSI